MKPGGLFARVSDRLVYSQMWEDPDVDRAALALRPHHRVVGIASAGCNPLTYLIDDPREVVGVDLNRHHLALARLKLTALRHLPGHDDFFAMFASGRDPGNPARYRQYLRDALDERTRTYWDGQGLTGGQRIEIFAAGLHQRSAVGRTIAAAHGWARLRGRDMRRILAAPDLAAQRNVYRQQIAPLFAGPVIGALSRFPSALYPLGIPVGQREAILQTSSGDLLGWLRGRIEHLACGHPIGDNYFAWQVFGRGYDLDRRRAVPPFLTEANFPTLRARAGRVGFHEGLLTDYLTAREPGSIHRFVLLDAQDWMDAPQVQSLWSAIEQAADPSDARVLFRTAGDLESLSRKLGQWPPRGWRYLEDESARLTRRDRSSLYGGVHLMHKE